MQRIPDPPPFDRNALDLQPVRCPGTIERKDKEVIPCPSMIDRRETALDRAVHEQKCNRCNCLYTYRLNERGEVEVLSMLLSERSRQKA